METETMLTIEQAGKLLNVSRASAYRLAAAKVIPTVSLGKRLFRVPRALLDEMFLAPKVREEGTV